MQQVAVGSENPVKVRAVEQALQRVWPEGAWHVTGVAVESQVRNQPMSDEEAITGARQRAQAALAALPEAQLGVGLEGGIHVVGNTWFDSGWIVVRDRKGGEGTGSSLRMPLPDAFVAEILQGKELGEVDDQFFKQANTKQGAGHFGLMSNGAVTREAAYSDGVVSALTPFLQTELFEAHASTQKVTLCGSIAFYTEMQDVAATLQARGWEVQLPPPEVTDEAGNPLAVEDYYALRKATTDPASWVWQAKQLAMQRHIDKIRWADCILVLNYTKNEIPHYVGANTLIEMGVAFSFHMPLYLLNPIPEGPYTEEIRGMEPQVLAGDLTQLGQTTSTRAHSAGR